MDASRGAKTPLETGEAVGSLMHLGLCTRPDILFAVTKLSQFNVNPGREHWNLIKHIFRYLSKTLNGIEYKYSKKINIETFCDAD